MADVTYYGAVGAESTKPELAYEFLRKCLTEECQWQENEDMVSAKFVGWPVRAKGDINIAANKFISRYADTLKDIADHYRFSINEHGIKELPILDVAIDRVQFATDYELEFKEEVVDLLNDSKIGAIQDADITSLLQIWLEKVQQHIEKE